MTTLPDHSYEEIREIVVDLLTGREQGDYDMSQFGHVGLGVAKVLGKRSDLPPEARNAPQYQYRLSYADNELVRDVFWDLFRQGAITLGMNSSNEAWPFFRLSHFGKQTLASQNPYRFHDTGSYIAMIKRDCPDLSTDAQVYLEESAASFYAGCLLSTCVMLGVAAETEFLRLLDVAKGGSKSATFGAVPAEGFVRAKIVKFNSALEAIRGTLTPKKDFEDLDTNLSLIQSVLRIARNESGHPSGKSAPQREQVFVFMQLFAPFANQLMKLRSVLA